MEYNKYLYTFIIYMYIITSDHRESDYKRLFQNIQSAWHYDLTKPSEAND